MDKYWSAWQELSTYPESDAARQAVVVRGQTLANSIQQQYKSLRGLTDQVNGDIEATVKQVNDLARQIVACNNEIVRVEGMGDNPNDLYDRRDLLVEKLSGLINVTVTERDPDEFMVHTDGQVLIQGDLARQIATVGQIDNNGYGKLVWTDLKAFDNAADADNWLCNYVRANGLSITDFTVSRR